MDLESTWGNRAAPRICFLHQLKTDLFCRRRSEVYPFCPPFSFLVVGPQEPVDHSQLRKNRDLPSIHQLAAPIRLRTARPSGETYARRSLPKNVDTGANRSEEGVNKSVFVVDRW